MPASGGPPTESSTNLDAYQAEVIVLLAYVKHSLVTYQAAQDWAATLMRFKHCELRLTDPAPAAQTPFALRVELFDHASEFVVESRACEGIADAASAFLELIPFAEAYEPPSLTSPSGS